MTASTPVRSGSLSKRRSNTPVVTNSTLVSRVVVDSPRTVCDANAPGRVPVSVASRRAAALAATRRGWVTMTRPEHLEATKGGTNVVLPVPGGATMTARLPCKAVVISSRYAATGSPAPTLARSGPEFLVTERSPTPASPCHRGDQERWPRQQSDRSSPQRERQPATTAWQESPTMSQPRFQRSSS